MTRPAQPFSSTDENALFDSYVAELPQLPKLVRYLDDFTGRNRTLKIDPEAAAWQLLTSQKIREQTDAVHVEVIMKRDGRKISRKALEEMRLMAYERMAEGEHPAVVYTKRTGVARSPLRKGENWLIVCTISSLTSPHSPTWCARSSGIQVSPIFLTYE